MEINTKYFGTMKINKDEILTFYEGLPAFEDYTQYILIDYPDNPMFQFLQSVEKAEIAFLIIQPWSFFPHYDIQVAKEDLEDLSIKDQDQVITYNIITLSKGEGQIAMTANLLAPIIINRENLQAKQVILTQEEYHTKHPLLEQKEGV